MARPPRRKKEDQLADAWRAIWQTPHGKLVISELMVSSNVYSEIQTNDPVQLALAVGERNVGARVARWIGLKPENYAEDAREAVDTVGRFISSGSDTDWRF